jgi:hypothetical protein
MSCLLVDALHFHCRFIGGSRRRARSPEIGAVMPVIPAFRMSESAVDHGGWLGSEQSRCNPNITYERVVAYRSLVYSSTLDSVTLVRSRRSGFVGHYRMHMVLGIQQVPVCGQRRGARTLQLFLRRLCFARTRGTRLHITKS